MVIDNTSPEAEAGHGTVKSNDKISDSKAHEHQCNMCDFKGKTQVTLKKHMNIKHGVKKSIDGSNYNNTELECSLCDDKFHSISELQEHIGEHLEDIEELDIQSLLNEGDMFECNLCSFESGNSDSIREHLVEHVMIPKVPQKVRNKNEKMKKKKKFG